MRLSDTVTVQDVAEAVRLMKVAMQQSSIDPRTGQIDMDVIQTGATPATRAGTTHGLWHGAAKGWATGGACRDVRLLSSREPTKPALALALPRADRPAVLAALLPTR